MVMDQDIRKLAGSLKASGVAASMMEAMEKAREILVGSEKTLDIMKKYNDEKEKGEEFDANSISMERTNSQINSINEEIASENPEIEQELHDIKEIDRQIKSNDDLILEEINKISSVISGSKIDNLDLPPASGDFGSAKSLNELYSEDAQTEQVKETVAAEEALPEETEIVMDSSEATYVEETPMQDSDMPSEPELDTMPDISVNITDGDNAAVQGDSADIPDPGAGEEGSSNISEIEEGLNDELQKIEIDNADTGDAQSTGDPAENIEADNSANMDTIIEDPTARQATDETDKIIAETEEGMAASDPEEAEEAKDPHNN